MINFVRGSCLPMQNALYSSFVWRKIHIQCDGCVCSNIIWIVFVRSILLCRCTFVLLYFSALLFSTIFFLYRCSMLPLFSSFSMFLSRFHSVFTPIGYKFGCSILAKHLVRNSKYGITIVFC